MDKITKSTLLQKKQSLVSRIDELQKIYIDQEKHLEILYESITKLIGGVETIDLLLKEIEHETESTIIHVGDNHGAVSGSVALADDSPCATE